MSHASTSASMVINPYELFGADPQTTSLKDLKKRYYELALLVHPDKNPNCNSAVEEMVVVHNAYNYCKYEIEHSNAKRKQGTADEIASCFEDFCKKQMECPPPFRDIASDVLELEKFNADFNSQGECMRASFQRGYGDMMDKSDESEEVHKPNAHAFSTDVTEYKHRAILHTRQGDYYDYANTEPVDGNFTIYLKRVCLTDYKEAQSVGCKVSGSGGDLDDMFSRSLEELIQQRTIDDAVLHEK